MEMEDQYGLADLRHYMNGRPIFPADLLTGHQNNLTQAQAQAQAQAQQQQHYEMMMVGRGVHEFRSDSATTTTTASLSGGLEMEIGGGGGGGGGGDGGNGRWPRQETLTLLEVRSRLDSKFKEANQKGPLWDEVSRIMSGEHGYQRSGKKCREKFENLYKYYKKTKEGKAGRQDGKHYRFFRQLEALYGESSNPNLASETHLIDSSFRFNSASNNNTTQPNQEAFQAPRLCDSLSLSNSSGFDTCSSEDSDLNAGGLMDNDSMEKRKKRRGKRSWKVKIGDFIDLQMRKLMEKQEAWFEKMMNAIETKEQERMLREEEWRKQEGARIDREQKFWANERAWIEARDASLMEALQKLTGNISGGENHNDNASETITNNVKGDSWPECEITKLIQLRSSMEPRFLQSGCSEEIMWEEIGSKMGCLGYDRSGLMCKDKWDSINNYIMMKTKDCGKKRKENSRSCCYLHNNESVCNQGGGYCQTNESNAGNAMHDSCFRFLMGADAENLWENYGVKLSKGENH